MTLLQILLVIAAIVVVAGVLIYNIFQEHRLKARFAAREEEENAALSQTPIATDENSEAAPRFTDGPDYLAETVLTLVLPEKNDHPFSAADARQFLGAPGKHTRVLWQSRGMTGWILLSDEAAVLSYLNEVPPLSPANESETPSPARSIAFCLLRVDRSNVTTVEQFELFQKYVEKVAKMANATFSSYDPQVESESAKALDKVCQQLDAQIALTLNGKIGPMPAPHFYLAAKKQGFKLDRGALRYCHQSKELFRIEGENGERFTEDRLNTQAIQNPIILLDIPQVENPPIAFDELLRQVSKLTQALSAQIIDDHQKPITDEGLNLLRGEVEKATNAMRKTGIEPGSPCAMRLFSS
jgi:hypothetical protein